MPVVNYKQYQAMLEKARKNHFAYPAINVVNLEGANAALKAFADAKSDGIIQVSIGGGAHASGSEVKDTVLGAISIAEHVHRVAERYDIHVALHTDHCVSSKLDSFVIPLIEETERRRAAGLPNLFNSHMFDGSDITLEENIKISKELLARCTKNEIILEIEVGVFGGEEDGMDNSHVSKEKLYTTPEDMIAMYEALSPISNFYMLAATFGNTHGVYKPGNVVLKPKILSEGRDALIAKFGEDARPYYVFHGGSGSELSDIHETLDYGVIKMNIDTDTQYAFTRPIVDHMFRSYDEVLKVEGEVGNKKKYDPRTYLKAGEVGMAKRIQEACDVLRSTGHTTFTK